MRIVVDMSAWGWPQWTFIIMAFVAMCGVVAKHGQPRDPYNAGWAILDFVFWTFVLSCGGFFA